MCIREPQQQTPDPRDLVRAACPLGRSSSWATAPLSVTTIMSQLDGLTDTARRCTIGMAPCWAARQPDATLVPSWPAVAQQIGWPYFR